MVDKRFLVNKSGFWIHWFQAIGIPDNITNPQESYNTPLEHTPGNSPTQLWKDSLYNLLVKV